MAPPLTITEEQLMEATGIIKRVLAGVAEEVAGGAQAAAAERASDDGRGAAE
jgi:hypothetical protein